MSAATTCLLLAYRDATNRHASAYSSCWWFASAKNDRRAAISLETPPYSQSGMPTPAHRIVPLLVSRFPNAGDQWLCDMCRITAIPFEVNPSTTWSTACMYAVFHFGSTTLSPDITGASGCRLAQESETRTV